MSDSAKTRRSFLKSSISSTFLAANAGVVVGLINTPGIAGATITGPGTTQPGSSQFETTNGMKTVIKTLTVVFDCPAIDITINVEANSELAVYMKADEMIKNKIDSLNPKPSVTVTKTTTDVASNSVCTSVQHSPPATSPPSTEPVITIAPPTIQPGEPYKTTIRIYHPGGSKTTTTTYNYGPPNE